MPELGSKGLHIKYTLISLHLHAALAAAACMRMFAAATHESAMPRNHTAADTSTHITSIITALQLRTKAMAAAQLVFKGVA